VQENMMDLITLKLILVIALVAGLGIWQLYDVNRELRNQPNENDSADAADSRPAAKAQKNKENQAS
jgi:cytoskeletal protein RodZ